MVVRSEAFISAPGTAVEDGEVNHSHVLSSLTLPVLCCIVNTVDMGTYVPGVLIIEWVLLNGIEVLPSN